MTDPQQKTRLWEVLPILALLILFLTVPYWAPNTSIDWRAPRKSWYAMRYHLPVTAVREAGSKPHDCNFMTAPMGDKNCRYVQRVVRTLLTVSVYGQPLKSTDDGITWSPFLPAPNDQPLEGQWRFDDEGHGYSYSRHFGEWMYRPDLKPRYAALQSLVPRPREAQLTVAIGFEWQRIEE